MSVLLRSCIASSQANARKARLAKDKSGRDDSIIDNHVANRLGELRQKAKQLCAASKGRNKASDLTAACKLRLAFPKQDQLLFHHSALARQFRCSPPAISRSSNEVAACVLDQRDASVSTVLSHDCWDFFVQSLPAFDLLVVVLA